MRLGSQRFKLSRNAFEKDFLPNFDLSETSSRLSIKPRKQRKKDIIPAILLLCENMSWSWKDFSLAKEFPICHDVSAEWSIEAKNFQNFFGQNVSQRLFQSSRHNLFPYAPWALKHSWFADKYLPISQNNFVKKHLCIVLCAEFASKKNSLMCRNCYGERRSFVAKMFQLSIKWAIGKESDLPGKFCNHLKKKDLCFLKTKFSSKVCLSILL